PENPPTRLGVSGMDSTTGIFAALGTMLALYHRDKTGEGQLVDACLIDSAVFFMETYIAEYKMTKHFRPRMGNAHPYTAPSDSFKAKDGYFYVQTAGSSIWKRLVKFMGKEELLTDPGFRNDFERAKPRGRQFFTDWFNNWAADKTLDEVVNLLNNAGVPCAPINSIPQVAADPHIQAREMLPEVEHPGIGKIPLIGIPIKMSRTPGKIKTTYPAIGQHNEEIYCGRLGFTSQQLAKLKEDGVI
ncbi:MAG: CoA transferase, partial [Chloroflexota bacterium]